MLSLEDLINNTNYSKSRNSTTKEEEEKVNPTSFINICDLLAPGPSHEADEGAAGEKQDEWISQKPWDCHLEERPTQARGRLQDGPRQPLQLQLPITILLLILCLLSCSASTEVTGGSEEAAGAHSEEKDWGGQQLYTLSSQLHRICFFMIEKLFCCSCTGTAASQVVSLHACKNRSLDASVLVTASGHRLLFSGCPSISFWRTRQLKNALREFLQINLNHRWTGSTWIWWLKVKSPIISQSSKQSPRLKNENLDLMFKCQGHCDLTKPFPS